MALSRHPNATGPRMSILAALDEADIDSHSQAVPNRRQTRRGYRRRVDQTMAPTTPGYTRAQRADSDTAWVVRCDARARTFDVVYPMVAEIAGMRPVEVQPAPFRRPTQTSLLGDQAREAGRDGPSGPPYTRRPGIQQHRGDPAAGARRPARDLLGQSVFGVATLQEADSDDADALAPSSGIRQHNRRHDQRPDASTLQPSSIPLSTTSPRSAGLPRMSHEPQFLGENRSARLVSGL